LTRSALKVVNPTGNIALEAAAAFLRGLSHALELTYRTRETTT